MMRRTPVRGRRTPRREASVTDLRQLAAAAAHEIRNPLNTMAIHCELLESRLSRAGLPDKDREAMMKSVSVLSEEVQRIDRILDRFLAHAGPPESEREPVEADRWLEELIARARTEADRVGVRIAFSHPPLGRWNVDAVTLGRALQAVLDNAVQATARGGCVEVEADSDGERATLRVRDHGEGIPPEILPSVCQVGYTTRRGHAGLGLAIAKQVVKAQHGGDLQIVSTPGRGTTVTLHVPLADAI
ncbi:MAG: HAMP domain-containing sensor histidine kinase [Myxococcales bacterium]|nr:HAMP domain-containing histidine kinase [Myxococcota bacterium]MDW8281422.1 HAMP domain-containing sensor histidine kinase [Myxococcales bacterium]